MLVLKDHRLSKTSHPSTEADKTLNPAFSTYTILVFKTTLKNRDDVETIKPHLESLPAIKDWSVDRTDCDHVLRVTGRDLKPQQIITVLTEQGYNCEVLP